jgi:hypothetical protein
MSIILYPDEKMDVPGFGQWIKWELTNVKM